MSTVEVTAHSGQVEFLKSDARFKVLACGRRWGKTTACILRVTRALIAAYNSDDDILVWWVAPVYKQSEIGFRKFLETFPEQAVEDTHRSRRVVHTKGGRIEFLSAENPDHLRGEGVDLLVVDEAAEVSQYAWENALRPTLTDNRDSEMVAISTPKGRNWFHRFYTRGNDPSEGRYESWNYPSKSNPFISHEDIDEAKRTLPERVFRQEYGGEFVDDQDAVFKQLRDRVVESYDWRSYGGRGPYTIGVDFARHHDWTVILALDDTGKLVHFERIQKVSWDQIQSRVEATYERYPGVTRVDATRDNKIVTDLQNSGVEVEPVSFSAKTKQEMMENLAATIEKEEICLPDIAPLINELELFEYETTRTGNVRYQAPEGFHDDCVDALALSAKAQQLARGTW